MTGRILAGPLAGVIIATLATGAVQSGQTDPWPGLREQTPRVHALVNALIVKAPGDTIVGGTLVVRDSRIVALGKNVIPPSDARIWDLEGKSIYPGLIDLASHYGLEKRSRSESQPAGRSGRERQPDVPPGSPYWNPKVTPELSAASSFQPDAAVAKKLRSQGIALVMTVPPGSVITGTAALVTTGEGTGNDLVVGSEMALGVQYETGSWGDDTYPGSLMGAVALLRQSFLDAEWHRRAGAAWLEDPSFERPESNESLSRLAEIRAKKIPLLFFTDDEFALLRSAALAREWGLPALIRGSNCEYRRLDAVRAAGLPVILPLDFPEVPSVKSPEEALDVSLRQLRHWYLAPECAYRLNAAGVQIAFTGDGLKDQGKLLAAVRTTVERGLSRDAALAALTTNPAGMIGIADEFGSLGVGKAACFLVATGDLFDDETEILETWVMGDRYEAVPVPHVDPRGRWEVSLPPGEGRREHLTLALKGRPGDPTGEIELDPAVQLKHVELVGSQLSFVFPGDSAGVAGLVQMSGGVESGRMQGHGVWPAGQTFHWTATRLPDTSATPRVAAERKPPEPLKLPVRIPDGAFGREAMPPRPKLVAFTNATIWTSGPQGTIENGTLLIADGKIAGVGSRLTVPGDAKVIDASGMHITPGIIDCHSHSAITGDVNEGTQTITADVRIGDVVDPDDIALYRELAGGLTVANLLHGSANAIAGQNQVIKLRWGGTAEELKFEGAPPGIKFALGENPKQSNWGDDQTSRYPQTRMGVEQIIRDAFQAAREYEERWKQYNARRTGMPPRRDLELEAVAEVISGDRLIHCHAYRQDEMEMLMRLAEQYDFRVATFQHVLEGYKVADLLARHGAGASGFSDWWAYKFEVYDAIPYSGALMHQEGVLVSVNSDSGELARRLNTEAAKAVKYGGVSPEEALKFVTINPAKQLRIGHRVGSLEPGKDADFVLWSGDPLSYFSRCEQTWIDGRRYFDRDEDAQMRASARKERALLIQRALHEEGTSGGGASPWTHKPEYSCQHVAVGRHADH